MKTWVKLYTEIVEDPDQGSLTLAERGIWSLFLALCGRIDDRDADGNETGRLDTPGRIAWYLRCGVAEIESALAAFAERGMSELRDGIVYLPHYAERQGRAPSASRSETAERVARYRERRGGCNEDVTSLHSSCNEDVTSVKRGVTRSDTDTESESSSESSSDPERAPATRAGDDDDDGFAARFAVVVKDWEKLNPRRQISALDAEMLQEMAQTYGCGAISQAIRAANKHGAISLAYVEQVLRNGHSPPSRASPATLPPEPPGLVWDGDRFMAQQRTAQHADDQSNTIRPASP